MTCSACGTAEGRIIRFKYGDPYCWTHYLQMLRHGKTLERTKYSPNEFLIYDDRAEIVLYEGENTPVARAIIDLDDVAEARKYKWHRAIRKQGVYVETIVNGRSLLLHHLVAGKRKGMDLDHINGEPLDNRKSNLRHLSHHANILNRTKGFGKSGRMGVFWRKARGRWYAKIMLGGKSTTKAFDSFEDAVAWREEMERVHIGVSVSDLAVQSQQ